MPEAPLRVLCAAFAVVPGSSAHAPAMFGLAAALHASMDFVTLKAEALPHLERFGQAQMLRVPVGGGSENAQRSAFSRAIRRQMESESYDVVHVRGPIEGLVGLEMRATQGFKLVYEMGSYPDESDGLAAEKGWAAAHVTCLEGADLVIVPSEAATRAGAVRSRATKLHIVQPGVDVDVYDWRAFVREPGAPILPRLLYLGSFGADRDLGTLLGAVREVARRIPVRVLLAGEPDPGRRQRVRRLVAAFDLGEVVDVRGEPPPLLVPQIIAAADICLAPAAASPRFQEHGDVPQPLLEYFAGRRPVVAAGVPAVSEVLRDEHEGLLYPPGDQDALTESIVALLESPALREHTAAQGYERARTQLSAGARRRKLVEVYEALVPGSQRRDPWTTGFDNEGTGQWEIPALGSEATSALQMRDSGVPHTVSPAEQRAGPQETEVLLTVRDPMSAPAPARSVTPGPLDVEELRFDPRFDTSPGVESGDIAGAPTVIRQRPDTIPGMLGVSASGERETGETGTDGSDAGEALPPTNPGTSSGAGDTAQFVVAPPEREPDTGSVRLPGQAARPPASTPPARGSVPPPAHGSGPPPAHGSAPPPARGSAPPPAHGSAPPPPPRPRSMPSPPSLARKPGAPPMRPVPPPTPPKKPAGD